MPSGFVRAILVATVGCLLAACNSLSEETVAIDYVPSSTPAAIPGAENVALSVVAADRRVQLKDRIGTKRAVTTARILPANDVVELVRSAVEQQFKALGFAVATGGLAVTVEVQNFYDDFHSGGALLISVANVAFTIKVKNSTGATLYSHFFDGTGRIDNVLDQSAANAKAALQKALADAVRQVAEDKALRSALLSEKATRATKQ